MPRDGSEQEHKHFSDSWAVISYIKERTVGAEEVQHMAVGAFMADVMRVLKHREKRGGAADLEESYLPPTPPQFRQCVVAHRWACNLPQAVVDEIIAGAHRRVEKLKRAHFAAEIELLTKRVVGARVFVTTVVVGIVAAASYSMMGIAAEFVVNRGNPDFLVELIKLF
jgi:hypothetical protein